MLNNRIEETDKKKSAIGCKTLFFSSEGSVLFVGLLLALLYCIWLGYSYFSNRFNFDGAATMTASHLFFGRAAGLSVGYAQNFSNVMVLGVNLVVETIMVLLFFPLFIFGTRHLVMFSFLNNFMERIDRMAKKRQDRIRRFGLPGLFLFVCIPFWMTGPLMGSVIGFLIGIRTWLNMSVVLGGTYVATVGWGLLLRELQIKATEISPYAPLFIVITIISIAVISIILGRRA